ncbi:MAG TPA: altronate dehydratase family protein [Terracidiphilus sp.]|nr:altronate dehydratase family protein [Terracidiphilus sp.]
MLETILQLDPRDNVLVALTTLDLGTQIRFGPADSPASCMVTQTIPAKHKMVIKDLKPGDLIFMYGMIVGEVVEAIPRGGLLTTRNIRHRAADYTAVRHPAVPAVPDASAWAQRTFMGYYRADGQVGTRNYWIVLPLVFCENRNVENMREALEEELGYGNANSSYRKHVRELIQRHGNGHAAAEMAAVAKREQVFPNLDGVRFLPHQGGCGGTRQDSQALCGLLAGYIHHPNVAGATVLSLGCQHAQASILMEELRARDPQLRKPVIIVDQQSAGRESALMEQALDRTFAGLAEANRVQREPAPLSALTIALQCGGSDGFSGISANPTVGYASDLVVGAGGTTILSEFPELHGVEQELINRCTTDELAQRFRDLMQAYAASARAVNSDFAFNPSPGNIRDGLITDAIKSAGAARKGGASPISGVLDYPEYVSARGLNLQCTPGNDVESVTAQVGAGSNIVLFTTGLGTPTGNPIAPVVKISTNTAMAERMSDIIDFDAGGIVSGKSTIKESAGKLLELSIEVASGDRLTRAELHGQADFIPWKRGVSL